MAAIKSLVDALGVLKREPVLFVPGLLYGLLVLPQTALTFVPIPGVPELVQALAPYPLRMVTFFIGPLFVAGLLGMTYEGREQSTSLGTFKRIGIDRYLSVLLGRLVEIVINGMFGFILYITVFVGIFALFLSGSGGTDEPSIGASVLIVGAVVLAMVLLYLVVLLFVQFYAAAIVYEDVGVIDGIKRSVSVVWNNLIPALGFGAVRAFVGVLAWSPFVAFVLAVGLPEAGAVDPGTFGTFEFTGNGRLFLLGAGVYAVLVTTIVMPFKLAFTGAFYAEHR